MKFRTRLRRLEEMLRIKGAPPQMMVFLSTPDGYEIQTGPNSFEQITEGRMSQLCDERPQNAPIPMILQLRNLRPETDPKPGTQESSGLA